MDALAAQQRGLVAATVVADLAAAGMVAIPFPIDGALVALNGPPGSYAAVFVWDAGTSTLVVDAIRARYRGRAFDPLEIGAHGTAELLGRTLEGMTFRTGNGMNCMGWFAALVPLAAGSVLLALGGFGGSGSVPTPADLLQDPALASVARTLRVE